MTDARNAGTVREVLITTVPALNAASVVREVLLAQATAAIVAGIAREVLLSDAVVITARQYAVTVVT